VSVRVDPSSSEPTAMISAVRGGMRSLKKLSHK
jgi:hypothetical protein